MKAHLLYRDRDLDLQENPPGISAAEARSWVYRDRLTENFEKNLPWNAAALIQDLELDTLFHAMALDDPFLFRVVKKAVLSSLYTDVDTIRYRQAILKDALKNPSIIRDMYAIAVESIEEEKKIYWGIFSNYPTAILDRSIQVMQMFVAQLKRLRQIADEQSTQFESEGFRTLFAMLQKELSDEYFGDVQDHLRELKFRDGVHISARLGKGNKGTDYVLRKPKGKKQNWLERLFGDNEPGYLFTIADRDENGFRALSELKDRGLNLVANALAQSVDHILSFFMMLRIELGFYVGAMNLRARLDELEEPVAFPEPVPSGERQHSFRGLYDVCLALMTKQKVVGNDVNADGKDLVIITGANQGGKSTFLRSIGLAQLMMQAGMFVAAESFAANVCEGLFTHYKREEDTTMTSGKLDEEMSRMSEIVNHLTGNSMVLFNESFAATNEREGSEIARQIVSALLESRVEVFFVTHLYDFAHSFFQKRMPTALFLRAARQADGTRTFKLSEGEPLETSYGEDLYAKIFGDAAPEPARLVQLSPVESN